MRNVFSIGLVIVTGLAFSNIASAAETQRVTPNLRQVPDDCIAVFKPRGWGYHCQDTIDEKRAKSYRNHPHTTMPGYANTTGKFVPSTPEDPDKCQALIYKYTKLNSYTRTILDDIQQGRSKRTLTATAAYYANSVLEDYYKQSVKEARDKYVWAVRNGDGDQQCVTHIEFAMEEHRRISRIINAEVTKGNRDLEGTGLNPYANKYNR